MAKQQTKPELSPNEALVARLGVLRGQRRAVLDQIIAAEQSGQKANPKSDEERELLARAKKLLNGEAADYFAGQPEGHLDLAELHGEMRAIDLALHTGGRLQGQISMEEAVARVKARANDYARVMRDVALAVIALERTLQARDALTKEINPPSALPGSGWALAGRLATSGPARNFIDHAARHGWITRKELEDELSRANRA